MLIKGIFRKQINNKVKRYKRMKKQGKLLIVKLVILMMLQRYRKVKIYQNIHIVQMKAKK
jgi:hypothetical protein